MLSKVSRTQVRIPPDHPFRPPCPHFLYDVQRSPVLHQPARPGVLTAPWRAVVNAPAFEGDLSTQYLTLKVGRYLVAKLVTPGDVLCKPLLPELYEPVLTNIGNGMLVLRGFEREGEAATVQEWRCEILSGRPA